VFFATVVGRALAVDTGCPGDATNSTVVGEYVFREGSGTNAFNTGIDGSAGDSTLTNGVTFSTDVPLVNSNCGYSVSLPATGTGATTPALETAGSYDPLAGATQFVIMAWVKRESASTASNQSARIISDTSSTTLTNTTAGFEFRFSGSAGTLALRINGTEVSTSVGGIAPNSNAWVHVAIAFDGKRPSTNTLSRNAHFYVNGIQRGDGNTLTNIVVGSNTNRLTIGNSSVSRGVLNALVGKIDDVRILRGFAPPAVGDGKTNDTIRCYMNDNDDVVAPTITCPIDVTVNTSLGLCGATNVSLGTPTFSDNCGVAGLTNNAPATFTNGLTLVTWTVRDAAGNSATCTQQVTVTDNEAPAISCPTNVVVNTDPGLCTATNVAIGSASYSDNCGVISVSHDAPTVFPLGTTVLTRTAQDAAGNSNSCQQSVTVLDREPPQITCPSNVTVNADSGQCYATGVALGSPQVTDNCQTGTVTNNAPSLFPAGNTIVSWTAVDAHGNTNTCQQTVTVVGGPTTDTDGDGLTDCLEINVYQTEPLNPDTDGDGMWDGWEVQHDFNPNDPADAEQDVDNDGLTNFEEFQAGTNPRSPYFDERAGWWKFDETNGPTAYDSSGQGTHGSLVNMGDSDRVVGRWGNALLFNGTNSAVRIDRVPGSRLAAIGEELTVAGWVKVSTNDLSGDRTIFSLGTNNVGVILSLTNGLPRLVVNVSGTETQQFAMTLTNVVADAQWVHVAGVYSGSRRSLALYLNGTLVKLNDLLSTGPPILNEGDSYTGAVMTNSVNAVFKGVVDDVRVYQAALSQQAVADLYTGKDVTGEIEFDVVTEWTSRSWAVDPNLGTVDEGEFAPEDYTPPPLPDASVPGTGRVLRHVPCGI
jgi:hypothetical protein